jgi:hypothetical protein
VTEIDRHPGLDEPVPDVADLFQRTQDWLVEDLFRGEEEYLLQINHSNLVGEVIVGNQGMAASLQAGDTLWSAFVDGVDFGLVTRRPGTTNAIQVRGAGVFSPSVSIDYKPVAEPGGQNWAVNLGAGYNSNTQQSRTEFSVRIHPAFYLRSALSLTNAGVRMEDRGDHVDIEFSISNQWTRLELDKESGGLLSVTNRQIDNDRSISFGRSQNRLGSKITEVSSLIPDDRTIDAGAQGPEALMRFALTSVARALVYSGRPFNSLPAVKEVLTDFICGALTEAGAGDEPLAPGFEAENVQLMGLLESLIDEVVLLSPGDNPSTNTSFVIPFDENQSEQAGRMAIVAVALKNPMGLGLVYALLDWSAPPARLIRGITLVQNGFPQEGGRLIDGVMHDKAMGPASWYFFGSGTSPEFAQHGLMSCRRTTMEAELRWLLDPETLFGKFALRTVQWLVNLPPAELNLLVNRAGLSAPAATACIDTMTELRGRYETTQEDVEWPKMIISALQPWWESGGREKVESVFISRGAKVEKK